MKYYSVLDVTPTTDEWIESYLPVANKVIKKHGGTYLARTQEHEQLEGDKREAGLRIVIEWESKEGAKAFMEDPEYAPHFRDRTQGSVSHHYLIAAKDDLA